MSFACSAVFLVMLVPVVVAVRDRKRSSRERRSTAFFGSLLLSAFLFMPGLSPIRGALGARRVDSLCSRYSIGSPIDPRKFEAEAESSGLLAIVNPEKGYAHAHAVVILKVIRMCDIEYANGRVTKIRGETHAP